MTTKDDAILDWQRRLAATIDERDELRAEVERLQRENGALARTYAACEQMLRERTGQLNQADAEVERLRAIADIGRELIIASDRENFGGWAKARHRLRLALERLDRAKE